MPFLGGDLIYTNLTHWNIWLLRALCTFPTKAFLLPLAENLSCKFNFQVAVPPPGRRFICHVGAYVLCGDTGRSFRNTGGTLGRCGISWAVWFWVVCGTCCGHGGRCWCRRPEPRSWTIAFFKFLSNTIWLLFAKHARRFCRMGLSFSLTTVGRAMPGASSQKTAGCPKTVRSVAEWSTQAPPSLEGIFTKPKSFGLSCAFCAMCPRFGIGSIGSIQIIESRARLSRSSRSVEIEMVGVTFLAPHVLQQLNEVIAITRHPSTPGTTGSSTFRCRGTAWRAFIQVPAARFPSLEVCGQRKRWKEW